MKSIKQHWNSISKKKKIQIAIATSMTILLTVQVPVMAWFRNRREAARLERINSPNTLFITAAHREDSTNLVMDDITVDGKWYYANGTEAGIMTYQDYVFAVAGDYVEDFTLQLAHTTNNPYTYQIFEADPSGGTPTVDEVKGRDYVVYKVTDTWPPELTEMDDNEGTAKVIEDGETVIYYRIKKIDVEENEETVSKAVTLNQTSGLQVGEINTYSYLDGSTSKTVTFDGQYLNMGGNGKATNRYNSLTYDSGSYDPNVQPLYWQCTNIPGSNGTSKNSFYHEYILRVYFNNATTTYKDTDIIYLTAIGNG